MFTPLYKCFDRSAVQHGQPVVLKIRRGADKYSTKIVFFRDFFLIEVGGIVDVGSYGILCFVAAATG